MTRVIDLRMAAATVNTLTSDAGSTFTCCTEVLISSSGDPCKGRSGGQLPGADVGDVRLPPYEHFGTAKVTQFELVRLCVDQQILWFDVSVAHLHAMNVRQRSAHLYDTQG